MDRRQMACAVLAMLAASAPSCSTGPTSASTASSGSDSTSAGVATSSITTVAALADRRFAGFVACPSRSTNSKMTLGPTPKARRRSSPHCSKRLEPGAFQRRVLSWTAMRIVPGPNAFWKSVLRTDHPIFTASYRRFRDRRDALRSGRAR